MTLLIWVRTSRHVDTLPSEIDDLRWTIGSYTLGGHAAVAPFMGGDHLLFGVNTNYNLHPLKSFLTPALTKTWFVDWSITEVGTGVSSFDEITFERDEDDPTTGTMEFDDRFLHVDDRYDDGNPWYDVEALDEKALARVRAAKALGLSCLDWSMQGKSNGATVLWVDLEHERQDHDRTIKEISHLLPRPYKQFWQGRTSIAFGYTASHDLPGATAPYGLTPQLVTRLTASDVASYLAFEVGSESVSANGQLMNPMLDFIWARHKARGAMVTRKRAMDAAAGKPSKQPAGRTAPTVRTVVVQRVSRPKPSLPKSGRSR